MMTALIRLHQQQMVIINGMIKKIHVQVLVIHRFVGLTMKKLPLMNGLKICHLKQRLVHYLVGKSKSHIQREILANIYV